MFFHKKCSNIIKNLLKIAYDNKFKCIFLHKAVFDKDKQIGSFYFLHITLCHK